MWCAYVCTRVCVLVFIYEHVYACRCASVCLRDMCAYVYMRVRVYVSLCACV